MAVDHPVRIGAPYQIGGTTYTPRDAPDYDEVGYAVIHGDDRQGDATASGEPFASSAVTAAHRTLPLPSYVEVTALDTGRTILVRINDRGPLSGDAIAALSRGAADQLGMNGSGPAAVRIRRVNPPEQERAVLRAHGRAAERLETPDALLIALRKRLGNRPAAMAAAAPGRSTPPRAATPAPSPVPATTRSAPPGVSFQPPVEQAPENPPGVQPSDRFVVEEGGARRSAPTPPPSPAVAPPARATLPVSAAPSTASGAYVVQVAAFGSRDRAERVARSIGASIVQGGGVWRVRYGPYPTRQAAQAGIRQAAAKGFENARIMANDTR
ncbi:MAG: septal ring lytic transglycosylase RlpA family protein [Sphingobium sp.]